MTLTGLLFSPRALFPARNLTSGRVWSACFLGQAGRPVSHGQVLLRPTLAPTRWLVFGWRVTQRGCGEAPCSGSVWPATPRGQLRPEDGRCTRGLAGGLGTAGPWWTNCAGRGRLHSQVQRCTPLVTHTQLTVRRKLRGENELPASQLRLARPMRQPVHHAISPLGGHWSL